MRLAGSFFPLERSISSHCCVGVTISYVYILKRSHLSLSFPMGMYFPQGANNCKQMRSLLRKVFYSVSILQHYHTIKCRSCDRQRKVCWTGRWLCGSVNPGVWVEAVLLPQVTPLARVTHYEGNILLKNCGVWGIFRPLLWHLSCRDMFGLGILWTRPCQIQKWNITKPKYLYKWRFICKK